MNGVDDPLESISLGRAWIDILIELRIDAARYLRNEYILHFDPSKSLPMMQERYMTGHRLRNLIINQETLSISWDWFIDAEGQAFDVLEEFKDFGCFRIPYGARDDQVDLTWPFVYSKWQWCALQARRYWWCNKDTLAFAERAEYRFEQRWHKKAMKLAKAQGLIHRGPKIPGAWID
jgi:hypothetical protein